MAAPKKGISRTLMSIAAGLFLVASCVAGWLWSAYKRAPLIPPRDVPAPSASAPATSSPAPATSAPAPLPVPTPTPAPADTTLTNEGIVEMVRAKAPASVIISHIRSSKTRFDLSTEAVIRLVKAGVPETVIDAMRGPGGAPAQANGGAPVKPPAAAVPATPTTAPPEPAPVARSGQTVTLGDGLPMAIALEQDVPADAEPGAPLRFTVSDDFRVAGSIVVKRGAVATGEIVQAAGKKRFLGKSVKLTYRLLKVEAVDGQQLSVRATPRTAPGSDATRPVDIGKGIKLKDLAASRGTAYIAYVDGDQKVSVPSR